MESKKKTKKFYREKIYKSLDDAISIAKEAIIKYSPKIDGIRTAITNEDYKDKEACIKGFHVSNTRPLKVYVDFYYNNMDFDEIISLDYFIKHECVRIAYEDFYDDFSIGELYEELKNFADKFLSSKHDKNSASEYCVMRFYIPDWEHDGDTMIAKNELIEMGADIITVTKLRYDDTDYDDDDEEAYEVYITFECLSKDKQKFIKYGCWC